MFLISRIKGLFAHTPPGRNTGRGDQGNAGLEVDPGTINILNHFRVVGKRIIECISKATIDANDKEFNEN